MKQVNFFKLTLKTIIITLLLNFTLKAQTTIVKGKLLDFKGKPSKYGLVGIMNMESQIGKIFVKCDKNGNYSISIKEPGPNRLLFSIPGHSSLSIPVLNDKNKKFSVDVTLTPYKYKDNFDDVKVMGSFNNASYDNPDKMIKRKDGVYILEFNTNKKEIRYELIGIEKSGRTVNAPGSSAYEPDSSGDYWSIMKVKDGKGTIVFDPSKLLVSDLAYKVSIKGSSFDEKFYNSFDAYSKLTLEANQKFREYADINKNTAGFQFDGGNYFTNLLNQINTENDELLKDYLKLVYISFAVLNPKEYDLEKAKAFFESLAPDNAAWGLHPYAFYSCDALIPQNKWNEIQDKFLKDSRSNSIKILILRNRLITAKMSGNEEEFKRVYTLIQNDYSYIKELQEYLKRYSLESKIKVDFEIPDFEVVSIDNANVKYSKKSMLGKIYLIDFWATWCGPCVREMEWLHKAYEKYKDKGFEIISLSKDQSIEDVKKFRQNKWGLPWKNSFIGIGDQIISNAFEVVAIPRPILVSSEGKVLALEDDLRGDNLDKTLSQYFK